MLVAFLTYQAGVEAIQKMAAIFGKKVRLSDSALITTILVVQLVGIPCAVLFGMLADRIGAKPSLLMGLAVYAAACVLGFFLTSLVQFALIALLVAMVRGGCQALSRSLFARLVPPVHRSTPGLAPLPRSGRAVAPAPRRTAAVTGIGRAR
jgi:UMF1 family MFS transporter